MAVLTASSTSSGARWAPPSGSAPSAGDLENPPAPPQLTVAAWLMLSSVATTRAPLMFAILPWVILTISERLVLGTSVVWHFMAGRLTPSQAPLERLASPGLWIGLAVTAGMLYMVIRLRRYRDDT